MPARVVLADDHEGVRQMLRLRLQLVGCEVVGDAENGREAVSRAEETHPDIVVMDLVMPEMDGVEATREIRSRFPDIKILGYTAQAHTERVNELLDAGADANFFKDDYLGLIEAIEAHSPPPE